MMITYQLPLLDDPPRQERRFRLPLQLRNGDTTEAVMSDRLARHDRMMEVVAKYGFIPTSILPQLPLYRHLDHYVNDKFAEAFSNSSADKRKGGLPRSARRARAFLKSLGIATEGYEKTARNGHGLFRLLPAVVLYCLKQWSEEGMTVLDPFCGRMAVPLLARYAGRHAFGFDASEEFAKWNRYRLEHMGLEDMLVSPGTMVEFRQGDSRGLPFSDETIDYVLTSPPYYRQEFYGEESFQLGKLGDYAAFLAGVIQVLSECFRVLRPGSFCTWLVSDFRKDIELVAYHADIIQAMRQVGFSLHDVLVYRTGTLAAQFAVKNEVDQHSGRVHEYIITGKKPHA